MAPKKRPPIERFKEKVRVSDVGCWEWTAYRGGNGYGRFYFEGKGALAHRWAYEWHIGPIPEGMQIDHLCRNRACTNPDHLEPVTPSENVSRGTGPQVARDRYEAMSRCRRGHAYSEADTRIATDGSRVCLLCKRLKSREHYEKNRALYIAKAAEWRAANPVRSRELSREGQKRYRDKKKAS